LIAHADAADMFGWQLWPVARVLLWYSGQLTECY